MRAHSTSVFSALLRSWRGQRGWSQLTLACHAGVSARHISFLETGRSRPSREMVLLLLETLDVPLKGRDEWLRAAGHEPMFSCQTAGPVPAAGLQRVLDTMLAHHDPFPMLVLTDDYRLVSLNEAGKLLFSTVWPSTKHTNMLRLAFDPLHRTTIENWLECAPQLLRRLHKECLQSSWDGRLRLLLDDLLSAPDIPMDWRLPRMEEVSQPTLRLNLKGGGRRLRFFVVITALDAPQNAVADSLRIESWFPVDERTRAFFELSLTHCSHRSLTQA